MTTIGNVKSSIQNLVLGGTQTDFEQQSQKAVETFLAGLAQSGETISIATLLGLIMQSIYSSIDQRIERAHGQLKFLDMPASIEKWMNHVFANQGKGLSVNDPETQLFLAAGRLFRNDVTVTELGLNVSNIFGAAEYKTFCEAWDAAEGAISALGSGKELTPEQLSLLRTASEALVKSMHALNRSVGDSSSGSVQLNHDAITSLITRLQQDRTRTIQDFGQLGSYVARA